MSLVINPMGTGEVFKAFRIAPNYLKITNALKEKIEEAFASVVSDDEGWIPFAAIGSKVAKDEYLKWASLVYDRPWNACFVSVSNSVLRPIKT